MRRFVPSAHVAFVFLRPGPIDWPWDIFNRRNYCGAGSAKPYIIVAEGVGTPAGATFWGRFVYLDSRLWAFTKGVRLRIAWAVCVGLLAVAVGIARLGLLGWLLGKVFSGQSVENLILPIALVAGTMLLRGWLDYQRNMVAHRTAAVVQTRLRQMIYDHVTELGPAPFTGTRTGNVILSMVEGVEQLEVYFGQYLPQFFVAGLTPVLIFASVAFVDMPIALVLLIAALVTLIAPAVWHSLDGRNSAARQKTYGAFGAEFLDAIQGLATIKAFGQTRERAEMLRAKAHALFKSTMWVMATSTLSRGITDTGIGIGAAVALGWGAYRVEAGHMDITALLIILMLGVDVFRPLRDLRVILHRGMVGLAVAKGIFHLLDMQPTVHDAPATGGRGDSSRPHGDFRGRHILLSRRPAAGARRPEFRCEGRRAGGHRRTQRIGENLGRATAVAILRPARRPDPHRRPGSARTHVRSDPQPDRSGEPGHIHVPRHGRGQLADGQGRRHRGGVGKLRPGRPMPINS